MQNTHFAFNKTDCLREVDSFKNKQAISRSDLPLCDYWANSRNAKITQRKIASDNSVNFFNELSSQRHFYI
jgi:hypothetical protein